MCSWKKEIALLVGGTVLLVNLLLYARQSDVSLMVAEDKSPPSSTTVLVPLRTPVPLRRADVRGSSSSFTPNPSAASSTSSTAATPTSSGYFRPAPVEPSSPCDLRKKRRRREPADGSWYNFTGRLLTLYAYSAFVDDRSSIGSAAVARVVAVADVMEDMKPRPTVVCRFGYLDESGARSFSADVDMETEPLRKIGMGWELNGKLAREYILTCPLPSPELVRAGAAAAGVDLGPSGSDLPLPTALTLVTGRDGNTTSCMPLERPEKPLVKKDFVLCVQVAFGRIDPMRLIEWLELQLLLGVKTIGIYDQEVHEPAMVVLRHYAGLGLVDLRRSDYIPHGHQQYLLHGSPVINDCMYRNLHAAERMFVYDIDEFILPRVDNLTSLRGRSPFKVLLENLEERHGDGPHEYMFRNSYFFLDLPPDDGEPKEFVFLRHRNAAPLSEFGYAAKSLVDQRTCIQMHNHFCWGFTKAYERLATVDADPSLARNQHYKKCHFSSEECKNLMASAVRDDSVSVYRDELVERVRSRLGEIRSSDRTKDFLKGYF